MGLIKILFSDPPAFFILVFLLLYSIIFHEVAHGVVASFFGDNTAKHNGRLTLKPWPHIDPVGALMLFFVGFGWAKPVPVSYGNLRNFRLGLVCVSFAGCLANIIIAAIAVFLLQFASAKAFITILAMTAKINIALGAFNLIPIPPLDGSKVVMAFLPIRLQYAFARFESFGYIALIVLIYAGMLDPVINFFYNGILHFVLLLTRSL